MTHLILILTAAAILTGSAVYCYLKDLQELNQFRANLRPGELCRIKTARGIVRARIIKRNSNISYVALCIDSRTQYLTAISNIYRP